MSLRKAIDQMCRACTYDPKDQGSAVQQIAACTIKSCPLHRVRPVSRRTKLTMKLLSTWNVDVDDFDDRAKALIIDSDVHTSPY